MSQLPAIPTNMRAIEGGVGPAGTRARFSFESMSRASTNRTSYSGGALSVASSDAETLGQEISGTIVSVATDVRLFQVGDRVCALLLGGG
jgi:hypothetical protein